MGVSKINTAAIVLQQAVTGLMRLADAHPQEAGDIIEKGEDTTAGMKELPGSGAISLKNVIFTVGVGVSMLYLLHLCYRLPSTLYHDIFYDSSDEESSGVELPETLGSISTPEDGTKETQGA